MESPLSRWNEQAPKLWKTITGPSFLWISTSSQRKQVEAILMEHRSDCRGSPINITVRVKTWC